MKSKDALNSFAALNEALRTCSEKDALKLMEMERAGFNRVTFLVRIYSRFNKERARRERKELGKKR